MELILWRHADAEDANAKGDDARALTKKGQRQARRMARWLHPRLEGRWKILVSPAVRAVQTVEPLAEPYEIRTALGTSSDARRLLREVGWPEGDRVIVVGHQPTLGEVAAELLGGSCGDVAVRKGSVWWFATRERDGRVETVLKSVVDPDLLHDG